MKKAFLVGVSLAALGSAPAFAADLAARPVYTKAPVVAPIYNWGGFYLGINAGGGWSHNCWDLTNLAGLPLSPSISEGCHNSTGAVVGGQIGYRWQVTNWVFGVEAQGDWTNLKGSNTSAFSTGALAALVGLPAYTNQTKIDAIGLFTGQVGYAWNNVLWYVKGGAAVTHDKYNGITSVTAFGVPAGAAFDQASETRWGGAVGTGVEVGFAPGWSVGVEYNHLFMGGRNIDFTGTAIAGGGFSRTDSINQDIDMVTVRVNYTFGGPVVARY
jgi:outer membrane immunogenic protein